MDMGKLFVEILVEELPALSFLREFESFENKWIQACSKHGIYVGGSCDSSGLASKKSPQDFTTSFFYTPRRIVILSENFPEKTQDSFKEIYGPPVSIAFNKGDKNSYLSPAGEAFLKKNSLQREQLCYVQKEGREVLYSSEKILGIASRELLASLIQDFLDSLHFGRSMRWGDSQNSFIRPIRNVLIFLDSTFIEFHGYDFKGASATMVTSHKGYEWIGVSSFCHYLEVLEDHHILVNQKDRRNLVLSGIEQIQRQRAVRVEIDEDLLDEVVAITERPKVLVGTFDERFLVLPKEIIILSMKENQRYFAVYEKDGNNLCNCFVVVVNAFCQDYSVILKGNEKVLRARLEDALFFYENDLKKSLEGRMDALTSIGFIEGGGNMLDKTHRELQIAEVIYQDYFAKESVENLDFSMQDLNRALTLSKCDLLTEVVYEFPSLEGVMGYYYALNMGEKESLALALKEQYMPLRENFPLPSSKLGAIMALSHRLDNILSLFARDKIPTGSKDPFGLRRAAGGVIRIALRFDVNLQLESLLKKLCGVLGLDLRLSPLVKNFFYERLDGIICVNPSLIQAVLHSKNGFLEQDCDAAGGICEIFEKIEVLDNFLKQDSSGSYIESFKRVANILRDEKELALNVSVQKLLQTEEKNLYHHFCEIEQKYPPNKQLDLRSYMQDLGNLKEELDGFFDRVRVNVEDVSLKRNRLNLLYSIYCAFLRIGDIKEVSL